MTRSDPYQARARQLCTQAGIDPDSRIERPGLRSMPAWCAFRPAAREEEMKAQAEAVKVPEQPEQYRNSPLTVIGDHEESTVAQMKTCMGVGHAVAGVICADGHLGYAQPVGGVIGYEDMISISGVGFDIACGNMAVMLDVPYAAIKDKAFDIAREIATTISFGIGRTNDEHVPHELFDRNDLWDKADMRSYKNKAHTQLGTVGSGNHYVDLFCDEQGFVWIGVHFGSRGLGHTSATKYLKLLGGQDGINVPPTVAHVESELGQRYLAAMELAGMYAYAGREWVVERVRKIVGGSIVDSVHNHHNFAWQEEHDGRKLWVVRKGATPAFPGQRGFVGGSMGDDAVILHGVDSERSKAALYSTVHGAGRVFGRKEAKRRFTRDEMDAWLKEREVILMGADLDESPMAYRRLPDVLAHHDGTVEIETRLKPFVVVMAGSGEVDPFKD